MTNTDKDIIEKVNIVLEKIDTSILNTPIDSKTISAKARSFRFTSPPAADSNFS